MWRAKNLKPFLPLILLVQVSNSILVNRTIDDGLGDLQTGLKVQYLPLRSSSELVWKSQHTCDNCVINPDRTKAYLNTWNSATCLGETVAATFSFHGTAIYIYFITSSYPLPSGITAAANCDFWVDGQFVGNYMQTPASSALKYNILVYANDSLSDALHTFAIQARNNSFIIFDYAQYTTDVEIAVPSSPASTLPGLALPAPTSSATITNSTTITSSPAPPRLLPHTGAIVGGTIAGVAGIALIALGVILCRRRTISSDAPTISAILPRKTRSSHVSPFMLSSAPAVFSIPPSKVESENINPFTSQEEAGLEHQTSGPPQETATPCGQGGPSTQGSVQKLTARSGWKSWCLRFQKRGCKDLLPRSTARPIPVSARSPSSNVFE